MVIPPRLLACPICGAMCEITSNYVGRGDDGEYTGYKLKCTECGHTGEYREYKYKWGPREIS